MLQHDLREIGRFQGVVGYWQFAGPSGRHLAVIERDTAAARTRVFTLTGDRWEQAAQPSQADPLAKAVDGLRIGARVFICTEVNRENAVTLWSADYASLASGRAEVGLAPAVLLDLTPEQMAQVQVPPARWWHSMSPIESWLFSPRLVRGNVRGPLVVASTADAQVALLRPDKETVPRAPEIKKALDPQGVMVGEELIIAFLRLTATELYPFWILPRYSGLPKVVTGDLTIKSGAQPEVNVSATLGLGPVMRFAMAATESGAAWMFALIDAPVGTDVVALERQRGQWVVRGRQSLGPELTDISAEPGVPGQWHLVYAAKADPGTTLYHHDWRIIQ